MHGGMEGDATAGLIGAVGLSLSAEEGGSGVWTAAALGRQDVGAVSARWP